MDEDWLMYLYHRYAIFRLFSKYWIRVSVTELHDLWSKGTIRDTTLVYNPTVTSKPVRIDEIWHKDIKVIDNTRDDEVAICINQDTFENGDVVRFKSWLVSPEDDNCWSYVSKHEKAYVDFSSTEKDWIIVNFKHTHDGAISAFKKYEFDNLSHHTKKCCCNLCILPSIMQDNNKQKKHKNINKSGSCKSLCKGICKLCYEIGKLFFKLFSEVYDVVTDILFAILLYNRDETDLCIITVITLFLPSIFTYFVSMIFLYQGTDELLGFGRPSEEQFLHWKWFFGLFFCSCCSCLLFFPFINIIATCCQLIHCSILYPKHYQWASWPTILFKQIHSFFVRIFEDIPQIIINLIFVYYRNDSQLETINILSIIGSSLKILYAVVFEWKQFYLMKSFAVGSGRDFNSTSSASFYRYEAHKTQCTNQRRAALNIQK